MGIGPRPKTICDGYVTRVKTILRVACKAAKVPVGFDGGIITPCRAAPTRRRIAPDLGELGKFLKVGIRSGILCYALLPVLGILSGRRLGLLALMMRELIVRYNGAWVYRPEAQILSEGGGETIPYRTAESLSTLVLHDIFEECGFIAWAKRATGPVSRC